MQTTPTSADVVQFIATLDNPGRFADAQTLVRMLGEITGEPPVMWGAGIVGFGQYHYRYASKREGDWFVLGFAPRKQALTIYLPGRIEQHKAMLQQLGKYKTGVGCLYLKKLSDADPAVLRQLLEASVDWLRGYVAAARAPQQ